MQSICSCLICISSAALVIQGRAGNIEFGSMLQSAKFFEYPSKLDYLCIRTNLPVTNFRVIRCLAIKS